MIDDVTRRFPGYEPHPISIGRSGDRVLRLVAAGRPALIAKIAGPARALPLDEEAVRLDWLAGQGVPAPAVVAAFATADGGRALVMTALPGADLVAAAAAPAVKVDRLAAALRVLHGLDAAACPFDMTAPARLARAAAHVAAGRVDEGDFGPERAGRAAADLLAEAAAGRPAEEDIVVGHGDPCLPNLMLDGDRFAGFVDCGRLGRADRWLDLALASRSARRNLGPGYDDRLLAAYGIAAPDAARMAWHRLVDEFF